MIEEWGSGFHVEAVEQRHDDPSLGDNSNGQLTAAWDDAVRRGITVVAVRYLKTLCEHGAPMIAIVSRR